MRDYIEGYIKEQQLSLVKFAKLLGYKSKTSIERIMDGESSEETTRKFALAMERATELSPDERARLREVTQMSILGVRAYYAEKAMWSFLRNESPAAEPPMLENIDTGAVQQIGERYSGKRQLNITLFNCTNVPLFGALKALIKADTSIIHYICVDSDTERTIKMVNALMPVLYEKGYKCYVLDETKRESPLSVGIAHADAMVCQYIGEDGREYEDAVIFASPGLGRLVCHKNSEGALLRWMSVCPDNYRPFKHVFRERTDFRDYQQYSADYAELEANRSIWKLKPDVGIDYVPIDILETATLEGCMRGEAELPLFVEALRPVFAKRFKNAMTKRKPIYTVFKKNAMRELALTGKATDHFWGMRPYTPAERIRIFENLLNQVKDNPYFHLYFLRRDDMIIDAEIACFEDAGVLVLNHQTDYDLASSHAEVMITHPEFMRLYKQFFMNTLLKDHVLSGAETEKILADLISVCRQL